MLVLSEYGFSREDQDAYAIQSYQSSAEASGKGKFSDEIIPVEIPQRRGATSILLTEDEEFKNVKIEKIPALACCFFKRWNCYCCKCFNN